MTSYDPVRMPGGLDGEFVRLETQSALLWTAERRLLHEWGLTDGAVVADLGCGSGALLARLAAAMPTARLIGVDHDERMLAHAAAAVPGTELLRAPLEALPMADHSVDLTVLRFVLQHAEDPVAVLQEARRVLRPGGRAVVFDVDGGLWGVAEPAEPALAGLQARAWTRRGPGTADRMIGRRLHRLLASAGFADVESRLYSCSTDEYSVDAVAPLLDPMQLMPLVAAGIITPAELAGAVRIFRAWCARPDAYALLAAFAAAGTASTAGIAGTASTAGIAGTASIAGTGAAG